MAVPSSLRAGRRRAKRGMTATIAVYFVSRERDKESGTYVEATETTYLGPGKVQTFESYEQTPVAAGHQYTVMRKAVHLPVDALFVEVGHKAVVIASDLSPGLVGKEYDIAGDPDKEHMTALRFPIKEVIA